MDGYKISENSVEKIERFLDHNMALIIDTSRKLHFACKRRRITLNDLNTSLSSFSLPRLYDLRLSKSLENFVNNNGNVDLKKLCYQFNIKNYPIEPKFEMKWFKIENFDENEEYEKEESIEDNQKKEYRKNIIKENEVTQGVQIYFDLVLDSIYDLKEKNNFQNTANKISEDESVNQILPYLINHIENELIELLGKRNSFVIVQRMVYVLKAVSLNTMCIIKPYVDSVIVCLLNVVLSEHVEELSETMETNEITLRDLCVEIIQTILNRVGDEEIVDRIELTVSDVIGRKMKINTVYGCLKLMNIFGFKNLEDYGKINEYVKKLREKCMKQDKILQEGEMDTLWACGEMLEKMGTRTDIGD